MTELFKIILKRLVFKIYLYCYLKISVLSLFQIYIAINEHSYLMQLNFTVILFHCKISVRKQFHNNRNNNRKLSKVIFNTLLITAFLFRILIVKYSNVIVLCEIFYLSSLCTCKMNHSKI